MCCRSRNRWARFILSWLGPNEAENIRRSHFAANNVDYNLFREGLFTLFGRLDFEDSYRQQLSVLVRSGAESVAAFASRTTDLSTRAYPNFPTELQLDLAVDHFISGLRDASSRDYLRRERARRRIAWQEAVQMALAAKVPRAAEYVPISRRLSRRHVCGHQTSRTPPHQFQTIAQYQRKCFQATLAIRPLANFLEHHATPIRTRVRRRHTSRCHYRIPLSHRKSNETLTLATAPLFELLSN